MRLLELAECNECSHDGCLKNPAESTCSVYDAHCSVRNAKCDKYGEPQPTSGGDDADAG
eukprot:m.430455 g.430455  ORF g.430455 m.430455 type:complete len:59 (-) comp79665_c0_seq1:135-311(-)